MVDASSSSFEKQGSTGAAAVGVGFSDTALLVVSCIGFCVLAATMYSILRLHQGGWYDKRYNDNEDGDEDGGGGLNGSADDYDERLLRADVSTLNRAQRRARARNLMKRQRRIVADLPAINRERREQEEEDNDDQRQDDDDGEEDDEGNNNDDENHEDDDEPPALLLRMRQQEPQQHHPHLSRKERNKIAKAAELKERRAFEETRRKEQAEALALAKEGKKKREEAKARRLQETLRLEKAAAAERERHAAERWRTFLSTESRSMTVREWLDEMKRRRSVRLDDLAATFGVSTEVVAGRIRELIDEKRVAGVVDDATVGGDDDDDRGGSSSGPCFVYFSDDDLASIAQRIKKKSGPISLSDIAGICEQVLSADGSVKT